MEVNYRDDDVLSVMSGIGEQENEGAVEDSGGFFEEEAVSAQRLVVSRLLKTHCKGRMEIPGPFGSKPKAPERLFNVSRLLEWSAGDPEEIARMLREGRVRARVQAAMGVGKTTRLGPYLARELDCRVLLVSLDAHCLQQVGVYIRSHGLGQFRRNWSEKPGERLCTMTYGDFVSHMAASTRTILFKCFDVVIFDEAFEATADVFVAKRCFSTYAPGDVSLLLCSATMRSDFSDVPVESKNLGSFRHLKTDLSVDGAIESGKLVSDHLHDRAFIVAPDDAELDRLLAHYLHHGVDAKVLDSAASYEDERDAVEWLEGDAMTQRVLLMHTGYGIGFNFPVSFGMLWPYRSNVVEESGVWMSKKFPLTEQMVAQHMSRAGRNIVSGSGGIVFSAEREKAVELYEDHKIEAFTKLCAANIEPMQTDFWAPARKVFPTGLAPSTAQDLLRVCLPVGVAARYLAADGRFARKYAMHLNVLAHPDHFLIASKHEEPIGYDTWKLEDSPVGSIGRPLSVPVSAHGELAVLIFAVSAMAEGMITVQRWRSERVLAYGDGFESDEEERDSRFAPKGARLRRIENPVRVSAPVAASPPSYWAYTGKIDTSDATVRRRGMLLNKERFTEAFHELEAMLDNYKPPIPEPNVIDSSDGPVAVISSGIVESPGGSQICTIDAAICEKMNMGVVLNHKELLAVIGACRHDLAGFAGSRLFHCYAGPWESILRTLLDDKNVHHITRAGAHADVYQLVDLLRNRFSVELVTTLSKSNVYHRRWLRVFRKKPSTDELMSAIRRGDFNQVAQTDKFLDRVKFIKELIDRTLLFAETYNVYLPNMITAAQRGLPIRGVAPVGALGFGMSTMPRSVATSMVEQSLDSRLRARLGGSSRHGRSTSDTSFTFHN